MLDRPIIRMPDFVEGDWLNTPRPISRQDLRGKVVLLDFWEFTCINCVRTLPYLKRWYERYGDKGLAVIGVHSPEFRFGRVNRQVAAAVEHLELTYPILLDNDHENWERFAVKAWPTKIVVDPHGYERLRRQGEGHYREIEEAIQTLLRRRDSTLSLPDPLPPLREEDAPGAVCYRPTAELYAGYQGGGLFGGALGNAGGYVSESPMVYSLPPVEERREGHFYLEGFWRAQPESVVFAGQTGGRVIVPYQAASVNAVLSPTSDPVELMLALTPSDAEPIVEVCQDGRPLTPPVAGRDVEFDGQGRSFVRIERARMVQLVDNSRFGRHQLELNFQAAGLALYAISFSGCLADDDPGDRQTYRVT
ncbi:MAG: redoxin domain-containing protein [Chloroflexota bacterium]